MKKMKKLIVCIMVCILGWGVMPNGMVQAATLSMSSTSASWQLSK